MKSPDKSPSWRGGAGRGGTHTPMGAIGRAARRSSGWGLCSRAEGAQAAALASGWAQGGAACPPACELGHSTSDAQSHSPAMLEMLTFSLFELQGILRKKKKRAINSCFGNGRGGISLNPSQMLRG